MAYFGQNLPWTSEITCGDHMFGGSLSLCTVPQTCATAGDTGHMLLALSGQLCSRVAGEVQGEEGGARGMGGLQAVPQHRTLRCTGADAGAAADPPGSISHL